MVPPGQHQMMQRQPAPPIANSSVTAAVPASHPQYAPTRAPLDQHPTSNPRPQSDKPRNVKEKMKPIIGSSKGKIKTIKDRPVHIFASRFAPNLSCEELMNHLKTETGLNFECEKLDTRRDSYASFHVTALCSDAAAVFNPSIWPEGALVRPYRMARNINQNSK